MYKNSTTVDQDVISTLLLKIGSFSLAEVIYGSLHHSGVHDDHEVIYILQGDGSFSLDGNVLEFTVGSVVSIPAGVDHGIVSIIKAPVRALVMHCSL